MGLDSFLRTKNFFYRLFLCNTQIMLFKAITCNTRKKKTKNDINQVFLNGFSE